MTAPLPQRGTPRRNQWQRKYPTDTLEVGECHKVKCRRADRRKVWFRLYESGAWVTKQTGRSFKVRTLKDGVGIWRES